MWIQFRSEVNTLFYLKDINLDPANKAFVLNAYAASEEISRILKEHPKGHVHSVFNSSFNLSFGGHLVHIGAVENGVAPFGIGLEQVNATLLTNLLAVDLEVFWDEASTSIVFPKGICLSLCKVIWTNHKVRSIDFQSQSLEGSITYLADKLLQADWTTGLAETEEVKMRIIHYLVHSTPSDEDGLVLDKLECLLSLACNDGTANAVEVFDYWIGRGLGLTPTGDDIITGICAVLSATEGTDQTFLKQLNSYLIEHGRKRTTHIALEYLLYATESKFHSHLLQVCYVLGEPQGEAFSKALDEMKGIGHTSGADTLVGVLIGIKAAVSQKRKGDCH